MKIIQINVDRRKVAQDLIFQTASKDGADLTLVSEPNRKMVQGTAWFFDEAIDACIIKRNPNIRITGGARGTSG